MVVLGGGWWLSGLRILRWWIRGYGPLRQYFPTGTGLSVHIAEHLDLVTHQLNGRPRKTLD